MSKHELKELMARVASDTKFRGRFLRDPLTAAACLGIALNASQVAAARDLHQQVTSIAQAQPKSNSGETLPVLNLPGLVVTPRFLPLNS